MGEKGGGWPPNLLAISFFSGGLSPRRPPNLRRRFVAPKGRTGGRKIASERSVAERSGATLRSLAIFRPPPPEKEIFIVWGGEPPILGQIPQLLIASLGDWGDPRFDPKTAHLGRSTCPSEYGSNASDERADRTVLRPGRFPTRPWLAGLLVGWLVGWLASWLAGWLVGWLVVNHFWPNFLKRPGVVRLLQ